MTNIHKVKDRRKAQWEIILNPGVTFIVFLFLMGIFLVWIGIYERIYHPNDGVVTNFISSSIISFKEWIKSAWQEFKNFLMSLRQ